MGYYVQYISIVMNTNVLLIFIKHRSYVLLLINGDMTRMLSDPNIKELLTHSHILDPILCIFTCAITISQAEAIRISLTNTASSTTAKLIFPMFTPSFSALRVRPIQVINHVNAHFSCVVIIANHSMT